MTDEDIAAKLRRLDRPHAPNEDGRSRIRREMLAAFDEQATDSVDSGGIDVGNPVDLVVTADAAKSRRGIPQWFMAAAAVLVVVALSVTVLRTVSNNDDGSTSVLADQPEQAFQPLGETLTAWCVTEVPEFADTIQRWNDSGPARFEAQELVVQSSEAIASSFRRVVEESDDPRATELFDDLHQIDLLAAEARSAALATNDANAGAATSAVLAGIEHALIGASGDGSACALPLRDDCSDTDAGTECRRVAGP